MMLFSLSESKVQVHKLNVIVSYLLIILFTSCIILSNTQFLLISPCIWYRFLLFKAVTMLFYE